MKPENLTWTNAAIVLLAACLALTGLSALPQVFRCGNCTPADWLDGFGSFIGAIAGLLVLVGLKAAAEQVSIASAAQVAETYDRRVAATFTFFNFTDFYARANAAADVLKSLNPPAALYLSTTPLTIEQVSQIITDDDMLWTVRLHLNDLEDYSIAFKAEAIDPWSAYHSMSTYLEDHYAVLGPLVGSIRSSKKDNSLFRVWEEVQAIMKQGEPPLRPPRRS